MLQSLWREQLEWDDPISESLNSLYRTYRQELLILEYFHVNRCYSSFSALYQLPGFCDASEWAYCAAVFLRSISLANPSEVESYFTCAKTRVVPLKAVTIPKLELPAAVFLSSCCSK